MALPHGSIKTIADSTGLRYHFVRRTLNNSLSKVTPQHKLVVKEAKKILKENGIEIK